MPLKKGSSKQIISSNVKEMMGSGMKPKQAIAASLANARKYKKMADGGYVEGDMEDEELSGDAMQEMNEAGIGTYPIDADEEGLSENVMKAEAMAAALQKSKYAANDNSVSYESDDNVAGSKMDKGGVVQSEEGMPMGNKPDLSWVGDVAGKSVMAPDLSDEAKKALMAKKLKRRYSMV